MLIKTLEDKIQKAIDAHSIIHVTNFSSGDFYRPMKVEGWYGFDVIATLPDGSDPRVILVETVHEWVNK